MPHFSFTALLKRFDDNGEKTRWTYIDVPLSVTESLRPGQRTSFRVRGTLDMYPLVQVALIPMGNAGLTEGAFILGVNATMRKALGKEKGATVAVCLEVDDTPLTNSEDLMACLADPASADPAALAFFESLTPGHQRYYSRWIEEAKTIETKSKRIAQAIQGFAMGMGYPEMIRHFKSKK